MARSIKAWWVEEVINKLNPAQERISQNEGNSLDTDTYRLKYVKAFAKLETVNRGVNMIVNACCSMDYDIRDKVSDGVSIGMRIKSLHSLLNYRPNPYQSIQDFRKNIFTDFLLEGNAFIYFDGVFMYHLPASNVTILTDTKTFIKGYKYLDTTFGPDEVLSFKDLSSDSIYRGTSRLEAAELSINTMYSMQTFQQTFFDNNAIPGLVFTTENTLSQIAKDKTISNWSQKYNAKAGAKRPMILDSGLKPSNVFTTKFNELDFAASVETHDRKILKALGVPPILLDGGNNANISPNLRLFYLETVLPIVKGFVSAVERQWGYDVEAITEGVSALQPDMKEISSYLSTLVNGGVLTPNEARAELRYPKIADPENDKIRIPANIAGSAANPSEGGAPKKPASTAAPSKGVA